MNKSNRTIVGLLFIALGSAGIPFSVFLLATVEDLGVRTLAVFPILVGFLLILTGKDTLLGGNPRHYLHDFFSKITDRWKR
jgi:hypothetical protein